MSRAKLRVIIDLDTLLSGFHILAVRAQVPFVQPYRAALCVPRDNEIFFALVMEFIEIARVIDYVRKLRERRLLDIDVQTMLH